VRLVVVAVVCGSLACTVPHARMARRGGEIAIATGLFGILGTSLAGAADHNDRKLFFAVGAGFVPVALIGAIVYVAANSQIDDNKPTMSEERAKRADTAMQLAKQAKRAARAGDCAEVQSIEPRVRALDDGIYLRFLRDPIIRTCRAPPAQQP
jgi:hypothetical protein